jgi:hypothetical protein
MYEYRMPKCTYEILYMLEFYDILKYVFTQQVHIQT